MALPRFVALRSSYNDKYLRYMTSQPGFLQFSGTEVVSPCTKFAVERAESGNGLVHLRCCYNNKYLVRKSPNDEWIVAAAKEPDESQSKWSCTLFKPHGDARLGVQFLHVQLGHHVCLHSFGQPSHVHCTVVDWESLVIMPRHVAFKGDNGQYLKARVVERHPYLQFASTDIGDPAVGNEVFTNPDGSIRIKSNYFGKFWRRSPNWIWADADDTNSQDPDTVFWPTKVDDDILALRNLGNNFFCKRLTTEGKTSCLNAAVSSITTEARMQVKELLLSREIRNIKFRLRDARIYNQAVIVMASQEAVNTSGASNNMEMRLSYKKTHSSTWRVGFSLKVGGRISSSVGIPNVAGSTVELSAEFGASFQLGRTQESEIAMENVYRVVVPPNKKVTVSLLATRGFCDVPFSYSRCDTLMDGQRISCEMDDGVYTGCNHYNFVYDTKEEDVWSTEMPRRIQVNACNWG